MTNEEKQDARNMARGGFTAQAIVIATGCHISTAKKYIKVLGPKAKANQ